MVKVSLFHPVGDFEQIAASAQLAEAAGYHGVFFGEHHGAPGNRFPQILPLLAGLAARTQSIRLGSSIVLSALYDPVHLAEQAAVVDQISGGRLTLGVGLGYQPGDFEHFGIPFKERVSRFEEGIEVLRKAWTEERFSHAGTRYRYEGISVHPKPVQQPHPPLWLAAWTDPGARRAGRMGDAYVSDPIQNLRAITAFAATYAEHATAAGRDPETVVMREILCAPSRDEALEAYGPGLLGTYRYYWANDAFNADWDPWAKEIADPGEITLERVLDERVIHGTPQDCAAQLEQWCKATGATQVQVTIPPRADRAPQAGAIKLIGEQLIPLLTRF